MTEAQNLIQTEIHNRMAGEIVAWMVRPPLEAGGHVSDVLVILESVIVGVMLVVAKFGGDEIVLDEVVKNAKKRLADVRLASVETAGRS